MEGFLAHALSMTISCCHGIPCHHIFVTKYFKHSAHLTCTCLQEVHKCIESGPAIILHSTEETEGFLAHPLLGICSYHGIPYHHIFVTKSFKHSLCILQAATLCIYTCLTKCWLQTHQLGDHVHLPAYAAASEPECPHLSICLRGVN